MADESQKPSEAKSGGKKEKEPERFPIQQLADEARAYLGVSRHVAAGAFYGEKRTTLTIDEAKKLVEKFSNRKATKKPKEKS